MLQNAVAGIYTITLRLTDARGLSAEQTLVITVLADVFIP